MWTFATRGVLAIVVGVFVLAWPLDSLAALALLVAIWAIVVGVAEIGHALHVRPVFDSWWVLLLAGIVSVCFGVAALFYYPVLSLAFMSAWVGFWLVSSGVLGIYSSFRMKAAGLPWIWTSVGGVISVLASALAFINPPATLTAILVLLAVFAICHGSALLVATWRIHSIPKRLAEIAPPAAGT
jgi:uncharacterized membrane protein HdeD (DUF308 family)